MVFVAMEVGLSEGQKSPFIPHQTVRITVAIVEGQLSDAAACAASLQFPGLRREDRPHLLFWQEQLMSMEHFMASTFFAPG